MSADKHLQSQTILEQVSYIANACNRLVFGLYFADAVAELNEVFGETVHFDPDF